MSTRSGGLLTSFAGQRSGQRVGLGSRPSSAVAGAPGGRREGDDSQVKNFELRTPAHGEVGLWVTSRTGSH